MKRLGIFETKNRLSEICEEVAVHGDPLVVTRHGKPLVRIMPYEESNDKAGSPIWASVKECREKYGELEDDFELPPRDPNANRGDPLS